MLMVFVWVACHLLSAAAALCFGCDCVIYSGGTPPGDHRLTGGCRCCLLVTRPDLLPIGPGGRGAGDWSGHPGAAVCWMDGIALHPMSCLPGLLPVRSMHYPVRDRAAVRRPPSICPGGRRLIFRRLSGCPVAVSYSSSGASGPGVRYRRSH